MNLKDKKVLVTGASSGIGQAIAIACAERGATVLINYRSNKNGAEETLAQVKKYSSGFIVQADLTDQKQIKRMLEEISEKAGGVDCLVNNAGNSKPGDIFDNEIWQDQFNSFFFSVLYVTQDCLKKNLETLKKIINVSSVYGFADMANPDFFAYSAAKAAVINFTKNLAKQYSNILSNAIAPGYTWTPDWEGISDDDKKTCENKTSIKRFIEPAEIAHMAVAILENDAMTGQIICVDGGLSLQSMEKK